MLAVCPCSRGGAADGGGARAGRGRRGVGRGGRRGTAGLRGALRARAGARAAARAAAAAHTVDARGGDAGPTGTFLPIRFCILVINFNIDTLENNVDHKNIFSFF